MVIKRIIKCKKCSREIDVYVDEKVPVKQIKVKCKCGKK